MFAAISKICRWVLFACLGLYSTNVQAGHLLGADISTTWAGTTNQYLITVRWYRDCQGLPASQQISICYSSVNAGVSNTITLPNMPGGLLYLPPFPYWPPMTTSCFGGPAMGIEHNLYQGLLTLPSAQSDWIISYSSFPLNIGINPNFIYVSTNIDNLNYPTNSSSYFITNPTFIYCINQPAWDNFASLDVDGDSLSYHLIPVLDNATVCPHIPFINPVPAFPPLQSSTPVAIDSTNGSLTFTPSSVGSAMVSVRVDEFRSGVLINSSTIEHVMYLVTGCVVTGIDEPEPFNVSLHPNPSHDHLFVKIASGGNAINFEVMDVSGKISKLEPTRTVDGDFEFDIKSLPNGIYTLKVFTENHIGARRFVKQE